MQRTLRKRFIMRIVKSLINEKIINDEIVEKMLDEIEEKSGIFDGTILCWYEDSGMDCSFEEFVKLFYNKKIDIECN